MITVIAFVVTLGILVTVHEYGHFQVARWCGVKVLKFSLGFGKPLYSRTFGRDQTEFIIAAIPLGGFVKMLDEREGAVAVEEQERAFNRKPIWKRMLIVSAGPVANLLLAIALYWILFMHGVMGMKPVLGEVPANSPAAMAGLKSGETITQLDGDPITTWQDLRWTLLEHAIDDKKVVVTGKVSEQSVYHELSLATLDKDDLEGEFLSKLGLNLFQPNIPPVIGEIVSGSVAASAGLQPGDRVRSVNGNSIDYWESFVEKVRQHPGEVIRLEVERKGEFILIELTPSEIVENGKKIGRIGAGYKANDSELDQYLVNVSYSPIMALGKAATKTWDTSIFSLKMLGNMLTGNVSWRGVSGPVTIASYAGQSAQVGWKAFLGFLALVSISLGVLNLLPIPVLDGGHLLYYIVEFFKGSPISDHVMEIGQRVGLALLGLLMVCALYNDINRLITG